MSEFLGTLKRNQVALFFSRVSDNFPEITPKLLCNSLTAVFHCQEKPRKKVGFGWFGPTCCRHLPKEVLPKQPQRGFPGRTCVLSDTSLHILIQEFVVLGSMPHAFPFCYIAGSCWGNAGSNRHVAFACCLSKVMICPINILYIVLYIIL